jgi:PiT family inorganic phosphate transporter
VVFGVLLAAAWIMYALSQRRPIHAGNVNDDWEPDVNEESILADAVRLHEPGLMRVKAPKRKGGKK